MTPLPHSKHFGASLFSWQDEHAAQFGLSFIGMKVLVAIETLHKSHLKQFSWKILFNADRVGARRGR